MRLGLASAFAIAGGLLGPATAMAQTAAQPLLLERKIPIGEVRGRIDHLGIDIKRQRLFVAELGNDSLGVVDLAAGRMLRTIAGLSEPQGVAYVTFGDSVYVANGGDGSVQVRRGDDLALTGRIELGDDADNVRVDQAHRRVLVGYGKGALAVIDPATRKPADLIPLDGHPEGFQLDPSSAQVFVNVPQADAIEAVDLIARSRRSWPTPGARSNFPMAIDAQAGRVLVVFRSPPLLIGFSQRDGQALAQAATCGDADDVFVDPLRHRVYVSCGEGAVDVFAADTSGYRRLARVATVPGARTSLFVPERDRLFVAARARSNEPAAIWVFRPTP